MRKRAREVGKERISLEERTAGYFDNSME